MSSDPFFISEDTLDGLQGLSSEADPANDSVLERTEHEDTPTDPRGDNHESEHLQNITSCEAELLAQIINELTTDTMEDTLNKLHHIFPEALLLASLDLIDRDCVVEFRTPWGRTFYQVRGPSGSYAIHPTLELGVGKVESTFCSCPSFIYAVLMNVEHILCKHVLAVKLAQKLGRCVKRTVDEENIMNMIDQST